MNGALTQDAGFLLLIDRRDQRTHATRWRAHCREQGLPFILVRRIGSRRSELVIELPDGHGLPAGLLDRLLNHWRKDGRPGVAVSAGPGDVRVRLPHAVAITEAQALVAEVSR